MKKIVSLILILVLLFISTYSNAASNNATFTPTKTLKQSFEELASKNIQILNDTENANITQTFSFDSATLTDNTITFSGNGTTFTLNYSNSNNIYKFSAILDKNALGIEENSDVDDSTFIEAFIKTLYISSLPTFCYLAITNMTETDLSLAYNYYAQAFNNTNDTTTSDNNSNHNIKTDIFTYVASADEISKAVSIEFDIDIEKLSKLQASQVTNPNLYTIALVEKALPNVTPTVDEIPNDENQPENKDDNTTAPITTVPKSGIQFEIKNALQIIIVLGIVSLIVISLLNKNKKNRDE